MTVLRWLLLASYYFFPGISNAFRIQGGANIYNVFLIGICNALETFKRCFKYVCMYVYVYLFRSIQMLHIK